MLFIIISKSKPHAMLNDDDYFWQIFSQKEIASKKHVIPLRTLCS